jgi:N-acetylmuramoyl-L-alanine amidase
MRFNFFYAFVFILLNKSDAQTLVGITSGKLPQLAYSNGADRLGSAKMGYIDTGVSLRILDSTAGLYHVQLSKYHTAYIDGNQLLFTAVDTFLPAALTESWSVKADSLYDYLNISLSKRIAYKSRMEINPARIIVDLYGVMSNTNWITQLQSVKEIDNVSFVQTEDDVVQVTISLKHRQHWGYSMGYVGKSLQVKVRHWPVRHKLKNMTVAIDAGHGGTNTGASGLNTKILEKNYTILFAQELQKLLQKEQVNVIMTREQDTLLDNKDRVLFLQKQWPDLFVSFHLNSSSRTSARGVSTYYKHAAYRPFTQALLKRLLQIDSLAEFGNIGNFNFQPIQLTECNSSLVEVAFLSNPQDEQMILDEKFRKKIAEQVCKGMKDFLKKLR